MFAANAQLDVGAGRAALGRGDLDQLPDAFNIKADKGVCA
jgi:hypothetical protein